MKVICDCDNTLGLPGKPVDDGQTILYLLGRPDVELIGITTCFGNGSVDEVTQATAWLLQAVDRPDIPLVKGEGARGQPATAAAHFLAEHAAANPGEITLLAIGTLGNLGRAAALDPAFFANLQRIVLMGGYLATLTVPGWEHVPELNLSGNPEASFAVLNAPCPVTVMNAQVCLQAPYGLRELSRQIRWQGSEIFRALRDWFLACETRHGAPEDYLWDLLPAVYISHPELFDANPTRICSTIADLESGTLVVGQPDTRPPVDMPAHILDVDRFYAVLYEAWDRVQVR